MENTNNITNDEINLKRYIMKHKKELQEHFMTEIKIMKNINKKIEKKQKEHMKKIKNIL